MAPTPSNNLLAAAAAAVACLSVATAQEAVRSVEARVYGLGSDYLEAGIHVFECEVVPTDGGPSFHSACTREQAYGLGGGQVVTLEIGPSPAMDATSASDLANARLNIVPPQTQIIRATSAGRTRTRRHVPDGPRSALLMLVNYADASVAYATEASARLMMQSAGSPDVDGLYRATSYGRVSWPANLTTVITVNSPHFGADMPTPCDDFVHAMSQPTGELSVLALVAQQHPDIDLDDFIHKAFFIPENVSDCRWEGQAYIDHCHDGGASSHCKTFVRTGMGSVLAHELGHNLGCRHAADDTDDDGIQESEYGDFGAIMGNANNWVSMNAPHRELLGYLSDGLGVETYDVDCAAQSPGQVLTLNISRLDLAPGENNPNPNMVRIARYPSSNYLLSFKAASDWDGFTAPSVYVNRLMIHTHSGTVPPENTKIVQTLSDDKTGVFRGRANNNGSSAPLTIRVTEVSTDVITIVIATDCSTDAPSREGDTRSPTAAPTFSDQDRQGDAVRLQGDLICGQTVQGTTTLQGADVVGSQAPEHYWHFTLGIPAQVTFDGCESTFDTVIRVYDRFFLFENEYNDDACGSQGSRSRLTRTLPAGEYSVVLEGYGPPDVGDYSMTVECQATPTQAPTSSKPTPGPTPAPTIACLGEDGAMRASGTTWTDRNVPCAQHTCWDGQVFTQVHDCPPMLPCADGTALGIPEGQCCSRCQPATPGSADSIAFTSRPVIKVGSGQMKIKAVVEYDFGNHPGSCADGDAPAIYTRLHSAADPATTGISDSYPLSWPVSHGSAKQALSVDTYVSGQTDLELDAWGPCAAGDANNAVATLTGFTYAYLAIVRPAEIHGPIDGAYLMTTTFEYDIGNLVGEFQAKASFKLDAASGSPGPSSTVSLDSTSGTGSITVDVSDQFSAASADAPSKLLLFISPADGFADFANRVISAKQTEFVYVEDFGLEGRLAGQPEGGATEGGATEGGSLVPRIDTGERGNKGMGGKVGNKGMGEGGKIGGKGMGVGGEGGEKGMGEDGKIGGKGIGEGEGTDTGSRAGAAGAVAAGDFAAAAAAAKSGFGIAYMAFVAGITAFVVARRQRARPNPETEGLLEYAIPKLGPTS